MRRQAQNQPRKSFSWPDVYFECEAERSSCFSDARIITLKSYYVDKIGEYLYIKLGRTPNWDEMCTQMRIGSIAVKQFVETSINSIPTICIHSDVINEDATFNALRLLVKANRTLMDQHKTHGVVEFGPSYIFRPSDIAWFYHH